jgi:hypothetical protein
MLMTENDYITTLLYLDPLTKQVVESFLFKRKLNLYIC